VIRNLCFRALSVVLLTVPALVLMALPAYGTADAPNGNNGTIKIDGVAMDEGNENNPHPGCSFVVDFFGYDVGTRNVTLEFEGQAPTGGGMLFVDTFTFDVASREGGNTFNYSRPVDLSDELAGIEPHPKQGWHVKLTAHVDGSQGADVKHKVFWIEQCDEAAAPAADEDDAVVEEDDVEVADVTDEVTPIAAPVADVVDVAAEQVAAWNAAVWANAMRANAAAAPAPEAAVLSSTATAATAAAPGDELPRTGYGTSWAIVASALSLAAGSGLLFASRRRTAMV
jgi:LPXTG-motif cell wall-anchored protein